MFVLFSLLRWPYQSPFSQSFKRALAVGEDVEPGEFHDVGEGEGDVGLCGQVVGEAVALAGEVERHLAVADGA